MRSPWAEHCRIGRLAAAGRGSSRPTTYAVPAEIRARATAIAHPEHGVPGGVVTEAGDGRPMILRRANAVSSACRAAGGRSSARPRQPDGFRRAPHPRRTRAGRGPNGGRPDDRGWRWVKGPSGVQHQGTERGGVRGTIVRFPGRVAAQDQIVDRGWRVRSSRRRPTGHRSGHARWRLTSVIRGRTSDARSAFQRRRCRPRIRRFGCLRCQQQFAGHHQSDSTQEHVACHQRLRECGPDKAEVGELHRAAGRDEMFSSLMSRWIRPDRWACSRGCRTASSRVKTSGRVSGPRRRTSTHQVSPSTSSIAGRNVSPLVAVIVHGHQAGMIEGGHGPGLAPETLHERWIGRQSSAHDLDRYLTVQPVIETGCKRWTIPPHAIGFTILHTGRPGDNPEPVRTNPPGSSQCSTSSTFSAAARHQLLPHQPADPAPGRRIADRAIS